MDVGLEGKVVQRTKPYEPEDTCSPISRVVSIA